MNIKQIILEEIDSFDWTEPISDGSHIKVNEDYLEIWPRFEKMFAELGVPWLDGNVYSNDYDGQIMLEIRSEDFMVDVSIDQVFTEDGEGDLITYEMYDPDEYHRTKIKGSYKPSGGDYLQPVIDKLRELVQSLIDDYKTTS
jgi:hypothetical protein